MPDRKDGSKNGSEHADKPTRVEEGKKGIDTRPVYDVPEDQAPEPGGPTPPAEDSGSGGSESGGSGSTSNDD